MVADGGCGGGACLLLLACTRLSLGLPPPPHTHTLVQMPFSEEGGLSEQADRIARGAYDRAEPTWSSLSPDARALVASLLTVDAAKVCVRVCVCVSASACRFPGRATQLYSRWRLDSLCWRSADLYWLGLLLLLLLLVFCAALELRAGLVPSLGQGSVELSVAFCTSGGPVSSPPPPVYLTVRRGLFVFC
jgi:hypothetical protein